MKKYELYSKEQLEEIINNSCTYQEVLRKIGYAKGADCNLLLEIAEKY